MGAQFAQLLGAHRRRRSPTPQWKLPILFKMIPASMMSEIKIKHKYTTGVDKTYEGFSKLLVDMANEKVYDRRAARGRGESDMDFDALPAEKLQQQEEHAARQADLAAADQRNYGGESAHPDYTDAEWVEYEKGLQDELSWLGARGKGKGKGGNKGDGRKGKGKGEDFGKGGGGGQGYSKGSGGAATCTWCGDENH